MRHTYTARTQTSVFSWLKKASGYNRPSTIVKWLDLVRKNTSGLRVSALLLL